MGIHFNYNQRRSNSQLITNSEENDGSNKGEDETVNINLWPQIQGVKIHIIFVMDWNDLCCSHDPRFPGLADHSI